MKFPALIIAALPAALLLTACGGSSSADNDGSAGSGATAGNGGSGGTAAAGGSAGAGAGSGGKAGSGGGKVQTFNVELGPIQVPSGVENTQCVQKRLGNPANFRVGGVKNLISSSSHHMILYRTTATEERLEPFDCSPFVETLDPTKGSPIMITQKYEDELLLPPGVAYTLDENQMVRIELHYINATPSPVDVSASAQFTSIPEADYKDEADFLFIGNPDIEIPPNSTWSLGPSFFELPAEYEGVNFFAITGHEHQYGTNVTVSTSASKGAPETSVYDVPGWKWDEPATVVHDPPFKVPAGGGFNFTCEWQNPTSQTVTFGESANKEMCFFWAYYYPSKGAKVCFTTDKFNTSLSACCPGSALCGIFN